jgi:hypothetical protein
MRRSPCASYTICLRSSGMVALIATLNISMISTDSGPRDRRCTSAVLRGRKQVRPVDAEPVLDMFEAIIVRGYRNPERRHRLIEAGDIAP